MRCLGRALNCSLNQGVAGARAGTTSQPPAPGRLVTTPVAGSRDDRGSSISKPERHHNMVVKETVATDQTLKAELKLYTSPEREQAGRLGRAEGGQTEFLHSP